MGLVRKFFAPLTNFLRIYRGLSQGTSEELKNSKHIKDASAAMQKRHDEIHEELGNIQSSVLNQITSKIRQADIAKKQLKSHEESLSQLIRDMGDPDADKEKVFWELRNMGFSLDDTSKSIPKSDELLKQFEDISKVDKIVDLRGIVDKVSDLGKETVILQQELQMFENSLSSNPNMKSAEAIEEAERQALQKGMDTVAVKEFTDRIKANWTKKKL